MKPYLVRKADDGKEVCGAWNDTPPPLSHPVRADTNSARQRPPRESGGFPEPLQTLREIIGEDGHHPAVYPPLSSHPLTPPAQPLSASSVKEHVHASWYPVRQFKQGEERSPTGFSSATPPLQLPMVHAEGIGKPLPGETAGLLEELDPAREIIGQPTHIGKEELGAPPWT